MRLEAFLCAVQMEQKILPPAADARNSVQLLLGLHICQLIMIFDQVLLVNFATMTPC